MESKRLSALIPNRNPLCFSIRHDRDVLIVHYARKTCYETNIMGNRIWKLSDGRRTLGEIVASISREYPGVNPSSIESDVVDHVSHLVELGLMNLGHRPPGG